MPLDILLINPNSSAGTTAMMVEIAAAEAPAGFRIEGRTAQGGPSMIVNPRELEAAAGEVERSWQQAGTHWAGVIISAFGDPGIERVRAACRVPVVGIAEAAMLEASAAGRRFGIATVTPDLVLPIEGRARALGLLGAYCGIRLTDGDPRALAADPQALEEALARAVQRCVDDDGAEAVIIGGGPLGQAAIGLQRRFAFPVIAPIPSAMRLLLSRIEAVVAVRAPRQ
ncbi:aspartate/glutamate racemase family protein [Variovorax saccharolyticus]|uniref:aspartate/glutamate racemase family protein n=1 Tax=Variovorax saccharolyticus TaxID=3053516 RepID=UPI0025762484|nr:aspartate/glutamate racemase family protein [Variovorax sp. J22R187]MDM0018722.1 aspartate/glutamate racemase family protein [Variovorax sp. J22R187]